MTTHYMKLHAEPFEKIKSGKKIYEMRLYDEKRKTIRIGDLIEFTNRTDDEKLTVRVTDLCRFESFKLMYAALPLAQCGYGIDEIDKASPADMEKYYSKEQQELYGVLAIKIELLG